jgi:hypothetical protein
MENSFENAIQYIGHLKEISPSILSDEKYLASVLMSYSAKTNTINRNLLFNFSEKFREWQKSWDLFDKGKNKNKPMDLDVFIDKLVLEFTGNSQHI